MPTFTVYADITLSGCYMEVEAKDAQEAKKLASENPDFETSGAALIDWKVTAAQNETLG